MDYFRKTYFREGKKPKVFASFIFAFLADFTLFFAFFAILMDSMCFCEFYFREKVQIREIRENISTRKLVHLKYMIRSKVSLTLIIISKMMYLNSL